MIAAILVGAAGLTETGGVPALSIPELVDRHAGFNGQVVEVHALMGRCRPLACILYADEAALRTGRGSADHRNWLSIGPVDRAFDYKAVGLFGRAVRVRGRFDDTCFSHDMICLDRVAEIRPDGPQSLIPVKDY
jgi:hypothetical protein